MKVTLPGDATGLTLYAQIYNEAGEVCIQSSLLFEAVVDANWATYDFAMVEAGTASMIYQFDFPVIPAGVYGIAVYLQAGGSPAVTDAPRVGTGVVDWGGTAELSLSAVPWNPAWDAEVESEVADALAVYDPLTRTEATADKNEILLDVGAVDTVVDAILVDTDITIPALIAALNDLDSTQAQAAAAAALTAYDSPTRAEATADKNEILTDVGAVDTVVDAILVDTDITIPALIAALNNFDPLTDPVEVGSLLQAALAQFVTDDTGQVVAAAGSVALLAQGAAAGNVTVGALTQAALAQFVTDDTAEIAAAAGSVGFLAQGAASIGSSGSEAVPTFEWTLNGVHEVDFVLTNNAGVEVTGLGGAFTFELRKAGGVFVAGLGTYAEIGNGWYRYTNVAAEADTVGPVAMRAIGMNTIQQNLLAVVESLQINAVYYTYTVTDIATGNPVPGVTVWVTTDLAGTNIIINNLLTDALGVARTASGSLPLIDPGNYYFFKRKVGATDNDDPDLEVVG